MKKILSLVLAFALILSLGAVYAEEVTLTMGSWRIDDTEMVQAMLDKYYEISGVKVKFEGTASSQYNANLRLQLDNGTAPDLWYSRSYKTGEELYTAGYAMDVTDIPGVKENFTDSALGAWRAEDGKMFAVPFGAVSQVVYYNTRIFEEQGLKVPTTYEEFIEVCQKLKDAGITPLANGIMSKWDVLECVFLGMLPNYVSGPEGREPYEKLEKKMNDEVFKKAISDFALLAQFLPEGFQSIENNDSNSYFATEQAAMLIDGSWSAGSIGSQYGLTTYSAFAMPAPKDNQPGMCFHADFAIAGNNATKHPEEVKAFLQWIASPEGAQIALNGLPSGFFPIINAELKLEDQLADTILKLNEGKTLDVRFVWPKLMEAYGPMQDKLIELWLGEATVDQVADAFAEAQAAALAK